MQSGADAKRKAKLWADMAPKFHLLSDQLGERMLSISAGLPRHNPKRVMAVKLASQCANTAAMREFRAQKRDIILNAELEISLLPDLTRFQWGRGANMGRLVRKTSKFHLLLSICIFSSFIFSLPSRPTSASDRYPRRQSSPDGGSG